MYLYESKRVFDIHYLNTNPAHALFLDTKFKTKYIADTELSFEERRLDVDKIVEIMKEKNIVAEEVYEIKTAEDQIRFELFKVIQNNFVINKCENCGRLFIPSTTSNNPYQKGRSDQKYCMHGLHYKHTKEFKEKQFKEWSKKARKLRDSYNDEQLEDFKIELKNLSDLYWQK